MEEGSKQPKKGLILIRFIIFDVLVKSGIFCLITTFAVALLLFITPKEEAVVLPVRMQETHISDLGTNTNLENSFIKFYTTWLKSLLKGQLGRGKAGQDILEEVGQKLPVTFILSFASAIPAFIVSLLVGLIGYRSRLRVLTTLLWLLATLPAFFLGYLLIAIFGPSLSLNPARYILPIITLGLSSGIINEMSRAIRIGMDSEMSKDYIETARAKGLIEGRMPVAGTVSFHAFRNAIIGVLPRMGLLFTFIISGSMIVEQIFDLRGLSYMLLEGLIDKDRARVLTVVLLSVILVRIGSIVSDFLHILLNPRYENR